jgi:hypothetical protein
MLVPSLVVSLHDTRVQAVIQRICRSGLRDPDNRRHLSRNLLISPFKSRNRPGQVPGTSDASKTQSMLSGLNCCFISFKNWPADVSDVEHRSGRDDSRPLGMISRVRVKCSGGDLNRHRAEGPRLRCEYSSRLERRVRATFAPLPSGSTDGRDRPQGLS